MKHLPESLDEAIQLRKKFPGLALSFSEADAPEDSLVLSLLPEIDLCFEDHGQFIFGLNLSIDKMLQYLVDRDDELKDHLRQISENQKPGSTLGTRLFSGENLMDLIQVLEECNALLKTFNGTTGRTYAFRELVMEAQSFVFQQDEIPLLIMIPKDS